MSPQEIAREIVKDFPSWRYGTHGWFFCVWCYATTPKREVRYDAPAPDGAVGHLEPDAPDAHNADCPLIDMPNRIADALAASAAKVKELEDEKHTAWRFGTPFDPTGAKTGTEINSLRADRDSDRQSLMEVLQRLQESEAARGASERALERVLDRLYAVLNACSEERYQEMRDWEKQAEKWKGEGDMYGWNFHMGMSAGANWCDIIYRRIGRDIDAIRKEQPLASPEARATGESSE